MVKGDHFTKSDESPVTGSFYSNRIEMFILMIRFYWRWFIVGDFAAQALISQIIHTVFPDDPIVGEEDASELYSPEKKEILHNITSIVNEGLTADRLDYEKEDWAIGLGRDISPQEVRENIDRGKHNGGNVGRRFKLFCCGSMLTLFCVKACGRSIPSMERKDSYGEDNTPCVYR